MMIYSDDSKGKPARVAEPVQVYLSPPDQDRLARLTRRLETSKSDVLRKGLAALERELTDPAEHPALGVIGIGASEIPSDGLDPAREHDRVLADDEEASWTDGAEGGEKDGAADS